ncbi:mCG54937, isoform CRA_a [Mus musculus]|nr:mCG54937, isoform CRA_a [Mus musculus]
MGPPRAAGSWPTPAVPSSTMGFEDTRQLPTPEERALLLRTDKLDGFLLLCCQLSEHERL